MKSEYKKMSNMETFVSALLVFCLTCGLVWTNGGILAMASTELPSENLGAAKSEGTIVVGGGGFQRRIGREWRRRFAGNHAAI